MEYLFTALILIIVIGVIVSWDVIRKNRPKEYLWTWVMTGYILMLVVAVKMESAARGTPETRIKAGTYDFIGMAEALRNDKEEYVYLIFGWTTEKGEKIVKLYYLSKEMIEASVEKPTRIEIIQERGFKRAILHDSKPPR